MASSAHRAWSRYSRSAYKNSLRIAGVWLLLSLLSVAATIGALLFIVVRHPDGASWQGLIPVAGLLLFLLAGLGLIGKMEGRRRQGICQSLQAAGFVAETPPARDRARTMFESVAFLAPHLDLRNGAEGLQWIALRLPGQFFFEHEWVFGIGRTQTILTRTVLVFPAETPGLPGTWLGQGPWFATHRPKLIGERRRIRRLADPIGTGHPAFDRRWISIGSETTASAFLTERVRRRLQLSPRGESWILGHGFVCCAFQGSFDAPMLERMWSHAQAVLQGAGPIGRTST